MNVASLFDGVDFCDEKTINISEKFLEGNVEYNSRYAIGKNNDTLRLHQIVPLTGIIDDFSAPGEVWHGIPVVKTKEISSNSLIANCSTSISPVNVNLHLARYGLLNVVAFNELVIASRGALDWPNFVKSMRSDLSIYTESWQRLYDNLSDDISRKTFIDIVKFRLSANVHLMSSYKVRIHEQYFEGFMNYSSEVFVDAGGYDGDTSEVFANKYNDYKDILFFEPSRKNMKAARERLKNFRNIHFYDKGLSDQKDVLRFDPDAGSASAMSENGVEMIEVDKLDDLVSQPVTFIKMDLEGWELNALKGAVQHLKNDRPKLAIAAYHDSPDFRLIFEFIENFGIDYDVFMRHYTQGWSETVLFFRPKTY